MESVRNLLLKKRSLDVCTIDRNASVYEAIKVFAEQNLGALIVIDKGQLVGLVTERDYCRKVILKGKSSKEITVESIMSPNVFYVTPDTTVDECMVIMTERYIRHLPVVDGDELIGIISSGDVIRSTIEQKDLEIEELIKYITDSPMITMSQTYSIG